MLAKCACGFERELAPGATINTLRVMAYSADGRDLVTIESGEAESAGLRLLEDPWVKGDDLIRRGSGPYRCPRCEAVSLQLEPIGFWD